MVLSLEVEVPDFMSVSQSQLPGRVIMNVKGTVCK